MLRTQFIGLVIALSWDVWAKQPPEGVADKMLAFYNAPRENLESSVCEMLGIQGDKYQKIRWKSLNRDISLFTKLWRSHNDG